MSDDKKYKAMAALIRTIYRSSNGITLGGLIAKHRDKLTPEETTRITENLLKNDWIQMDPNTGILRIVPVPDTPGDNYQ